jgi:hypothetical protein
MAITIQLYLTDLSYRTADGGMLRSVAKDLIFHECGMCSRVRNRLLEDSSLQYCSTSLPAKAHQDDTVVVLQVEVLDYVPVKTNRGTKHLFQNLTVPPLYGCPAFSRATARAKF